MNDVRLRWSVFPWYRIVGDEPPTLFTATNADGTEIIATERVDPATIRRGAKIHDSKRRVNYMATVDPVTEKLDYLSIELEGFIDDARLITLRSIPRERIEATVAAFVRDLRPDEFSVVFEGGLLEGENERPGRTPTAREVAALMAERGWGRQELAAYFDRNVRTVDGWIARARAMPDSAAPRAATGKNFRANKTTDGKSPRNN